MNSTMRSLPSASNESTFRTAASGIGISLRLGIGEDTVCANLRLAVGPFFPDAVVSAGQLFCRCIRCLRLSGAAAKCRCDFFGQIAHASIHPVSRTGLVGKPAVDRQDHFIGGRAVTERLVLVAQPQELLLAIALADVHAELDERLVNDVPEGIGLGGVRGAFDGDGPLVVGVAGGAPRAVFLLHVKADAAILVDAIVGGSLRAGFCKPVTEALRRTLANDAVRCDPVDGVGALTGVIRTQLGVCRQWAVRICHGIVGVTEKHPILTGIGVALGTATVAAVRESLSGSVSSGSGSTSRSRPDYYPSYDSKDDYSSPSDQKDDYFEPSEERDYPDERSSPEEHTVPAHGQHYHTKDGVIWKEKESYQRGGKHDDD